MANLSDAYGIFKLINGEKLTKDTLREFLKLMYITFENINYPTILKMIDENNDEKTEQNIQNFIENKYETEFAGVGRWLYRYNIDNIINGINHESETIIKRWHNVLDEMIEKDIILSYKFNDFEPGCAPDIIFKVHYDVKPIKQNNEYKLQEVTYHENEIIANEDTMYEYGYISDESYTLEDIKSGQCDEILDFNDEDERNEWLEEYEDYFIQNDREYVYNLDAECFVLKSEEKTLTV